MVVELPPPDPETPRQGREQESDDLPGGGIITSTDVLQIWLPEPLVDLAKRESRSFVVEKHQELLKILERPEYQDLFYAFTARGYQVNFGSADITFIRYPLRVHEDLQEFLNILATAAGSLPRSPAADYSGAVCPRRAHGIVPARATRVDPGLTPSARSCPIGIRTMTCLRPGSIGDEARGTMQVLVTFHQETACIRGLSCPLSICFCGLA